jgi:hypothetical protein
MSRYVKVVNEDGASITTKVVMKQLHYMHVTPRLKLLYLSEEIVKQMRWHKERKRDSEDPDIMSHPADNEAWEALDHFHPEFAWGPSSVRIGLSTGGFQPHSEASILYSCWPVFIMPHNLKKGFIFLALVILSPK